MPLTVTLRGPPLAVGAFVLAAWTLVVLAFVIALAMAALAERWLARHYTFAVAVPA